MRLSGLAVAAVLVATTTGLDAGGQVARAADVRIEHGEATRSAGTWTFTVTLKHSDEGWDHYADLWQVLDPAGRVLAERVLTHPHVEEQPFTRSLRGVEIPQDIATVFIRARDSRHGFAPQLFEIDLSR
ncbi:hypothetical protein [Roseibium sp.]|uniref:hypothetical protein n=1 Tax=Roseibium sp. TaxID=1936156 RepID=UPI003A96A68A